MKSLSRPISGTVALACALVGGLAFSCLTAGCNEWQNQQPTSQPAQPAHRFVERPANHPGDEPSAQEVSRMKEPNVLGVSCFYSGRNPWMWNEDRTRVQGIKVSSLFLLGPDSTGVFGDGVIHPRLFEAHRDAEGTLQYRLVKEWTFNVEQAMLYRIKRRIPGGWGYTLYLPWGDMDLTGREIRVTVSFERIDGVSISGSKNDFRVPKPGQS